jgi:RNA polymerase sigma-70 factor (ECF subfamily)
MSNSDRFYKLIWPHAAMIKRMALALSRHEAEADDLAQETLLKAFRHLDQFREGTQVRSWLMTILRNTRIDRLRSEARFRETLWLDEQLVEVEDTADSTPAADSTRWRDPRALLETLSDQQLIDGLLELPEEIRWTLLLVDVEGLEMKDAAGVMGIPTGTVKSRLHRGRGMLREQLEPKVAGALP